MLVNDFLKSFRKILKENNIEIDINLIVDFNIGEILLRCEDNENSKTYITICDAKKIMEEIGKYKKPNVSIFWELINKLTNSYYKEDLLTTKELSRILGISYYKTKGVLKNVPHYKVGNRKYYKFMEVNLHFKKKGNDNGN